jgi:hypothetical protein
MAFYTTEEFKAQIEDCVADGMTYLQAYQTVVEREREEELRYQRWIADLQTEDIDSNEEYSY